MGAAKSKRGMMIKENIIKWQVMHVWRELINYESNDSIGYSTLNIIKINAESDI